MTVNCKKLLHFLIFLYVFNLGNSFKHFYQPHYDSCFSPDWEINPVMSFSKDEFLQTTSDILQSIFGSSFDEKDMKRFVQCVEETIPDLTIKSCDEFAIVDECYAKIYGNDMIITKRFSFIPSGLTSKFGNMAKDKVANKMSEYIVSFFQKKLAEGISYMIGKVFKEKNEGEENGEAIEANKQVQRKPSRKADSFGDIITTPSKWLNVFKNPVLRKGTANKTLYKKRFSFIPNAFKDKAKDKMTQKVSKIVTELVSERITQLITLLMNKLFGDEQPNIPETQQSETLASSILNSISKPQNLLKPNNWLNFLKKPKKRSRILKRKIH